MKVAALIRFPEGISPEQVHEFMSEWRDELIKDENEIAFDDYISTKSFNPDLGGVVIYQP